MAKLKISVELEECGDSNSTSISREYSEEEFITFTKAFRTFVDSATALGYSIPSKVKELVNDMEDEELYK